MIISEIVTLGIYAFSMVFLPEYFGAFFFFHFMSARRPRLPASYPVLPSHFISVFIRFRCPFVCSHCLFQIYRLLSQCGSGGKSRLLLR